MSKRRDRRTIRPPVRIVEGGGPEHTCGKRRYPTGAKARRHLDVIRRLGSPGEEGHKPIRAYACDHCGGWHLTSDGQ